MLWGMDGRTDPPEMLRPKEVEPLTGDEPFSGTDATVGDFWSWGFSDLRANTTRGGLAEFLVAHAVGAQQRVRDAWDNFDVLSPAGTRIEVKASAYLQSWVQREHSKISFSRLSGLEFDASSNEYSAERSVRADVFVFCVHTEREPMAYDPLDVSKWEFYAVPADAVRAAGTRTVGLAWVRAQAGQPVPFASLSGAIAAASSPGAHEVPGAG